MAMTSNLANLSVLKHDLLKLSLKQKLQYLEKLPVISKELQEHPLFSSLYKILSESQKVAVLSALAADQRACIFSFPKEKKYINELFVEFAASLEEIDRFYADIGGIIGYQCLALSLLEKAENQHEKTEFFPPPSFDIREDSKSLREAILWGILKLEEFAEIFPVGGAADRLHLVDMETGQELPAAKLEFIGRPLLEGMIRDTQAREYLHYKLFGKQITTPIALMTSVEKNNHHHVVSICEEKNWFGKSRDNFYFFTQPLVPTFKQDGAWCLAGPLQLVLKPGGHGVIWKLALESGILQNLQEVGRVKALVRQINNPIAGTDYGILAFLGYGVTQNKLFGFASCLRKVGAQEGINVLKVISDQSRARLTLSNIEYCNFTLQGIEDKPSIQDPDHSLFPSNTNILFVDIKAVEKAAAKMPYPGMLVNFKNHEHYDPLSELHHETPIARIESTMQNVADIFEDIIDVATLSKSHNHSQSFVTFNKRAKTISTTKKPHIEGKSLLETPEGCFYDYLQNASELLKNYCGFTVPSMPSHDDYLQHGPSFLFSYHPGLGPLYSIIAKKIQGGMIAPRSELELEIADIYIHNLQLNGSLRIVAEQPLGHFDNDVLKFSSKTGRCILNNVKVFNKGVDFSQSAPFWKGHPKRKESLEIILKGHSELVIDGVGINSARKIEVPHGHKMTIYNENGQIKTTLEPLESTNDFWNYTVGDESMIELARA